MEVEPKKAPRKPRLLALAIALVAVAVLLGILLAITLGAVPQVAAKTKPAMLRLAWATFFALGLTLILLVWVVIRFAIERTRPTGPKHTEYVDAWSLAGKRMKVEPPPEDEEQDDDPEDDEPEGPRP